MKQMMVATVAGLLMTSAVIVSLEDMPMLQVSANTRKPVACASSDTEWKVMPAEHPVCQEVAKGVADVEWVP